MPTDNNYWGNPPHVPDSASGVVGGATQGSPAEIDSAGSQSQAVQPQGALNQQPAQQQPAFAGQSQQAVPAAQPQASQAPAGYAQAQPAQPFAQQPASAPSSPYTGAVQFQEQQPQQKSHGWIVAIVVIVCLFLLSAFAVKSCTDTLQVASSFGTGYGLSAQAPSGDSVAIINIDGTIQYDGSACSPEGLKELLDEAEEDDRIKAVVLRVNSGGGTATAGEEMAEYVRQFSKPVVVSSASINASAAYEISSQADYIYVAKSTEIGAIGTAMELTDLSGLLDMLGVNMDVITSAEQKDSSYGYRPLTDEERAYYQEMVNDINEVFVQNVADGRKMSVDAVRALATGMPFTGMKAVENGLADAVGTREDALDKAAELAGISSYAVYDMSFDTYDLSSLAYLLGETDSQSDSLKDLLVDRIR